MNEAFNKLAFIYALLYSSKAFNDKRTGAKGVNPLT